MYPALNQCPVCQSDLTITQLHCHTCDTNIDGQFYSGPFTTLSSEQLAFVELFVRKEGKLNRMEAELKLSYPTIRNRLHEVIRALGYEPGKDEFAGLSDKDRRKVIEDLDKGIISTEEAMSKLQE